MLSASSFSDRPLARQASHVRSTTPIPDNSAVSQPHPTVRGPAAGESCSVEDVTQVSELMVSVTDALLIPSSVAF